MNPIKSLGLPVPVVRCHCEHGKKQVVRVDVLETSHLHVIHAHTLRLLQEVCHAARKPVGNDHVVCERLLCERHAKALRVPHRVQRPQTRTMYCVHQRLVTRGM